MLTNTYYPDLYRFKLVERVLVALASPVVDKLSRFPLHVSTFDCCYMDVFTKRLVTGVSRRRSARSVQGCPPVNRGVNGVTPRETKHSFIR